jgi:hypothetical protein
MTNIFRLSILLCLLVSTSLGRAQNPILTKEQNDKWIASLKTLTLDKQLQLIIDRLLLDTNTYVKRNYTDGIKHVDSLGARVECAGKPTLIVGGCPMTIDNKTQTAKVISLTKLLTLQYIGKIVVLGHKDPATIALGGTVGQYGLILVTPTRNKYVRHFKRLGLMPNY